MSMFNHGYKAIVISKTYKKYGLIKYRQTTKTFEQLNETALRLNKLEKLVNYSPFKYKDLSFNLNDFLDLKLPIDDLYVIRESTRNKKIGYYYKNKG